MEPNLEDGLVFCEGCLQLARIEKVTMLKTNEGFTALVPQALARLSVLYHWFYEAKTIPQLSV